MFVNLGNRAAAGAISNWKQSTVMLTKSQKILLLEMVLDKKEILFSRFNPRITREKQTSEWKKIVERLLAVGAEVKDWKALRDQHYANLLRSTKAKVDACKRSGEGAKQMNEMDELVLQILGEESGRLKPVSIEDTPVVFGDAAGITLHTGSGEPFHYTPSTTTSGMQNFQAQEAHEGASEAVLELTDHPPITSVVVVEEKPKISQKQPMDKLEESTKEILALRKRKLELEIYVLELQAKKLEKELC